MKSLSLAVCLPVDPYCLLQVYINISKMTRWGHGSGDVFWVDWSPPKKGGLPVHEDKYQWDLHLHMLIAIIVYYCIQISPNQGWFFHDMFDFNDSTSEKILPPIIISLVGFWWATSGHPFPSPFPLWTAVQGWYLVLEYCPCGDLTTLMEEYRECGASGSSGEKLPSGMKQATDPFWTKSFWVVGGVFRLTFEKRSFTSQFSNHFRPREGHACPRTGLTQMPWLFTLKVLLQAGNWTTFRCLKGLSLRRWLSNSCWFCC